MIAEKNEEDTRTVAVQMDKELLLQVSSPTHFSDLLQMEKALDNLLSVAFCAVSWLQIQL